MWLDLFYHWGGLNPAIFLAINGVRGPLIDALMVAGTTLGNTWNVVAIPVAMLFFIAFGRLWPQNAVSRHLPAERVLIEATLVFALGSLLTTLLVFVPKEIFNMPRPSVALPPGSVHVLVPPTEPYSFPSGHSAYAMLVTVTFWPYGRWRGKLALFCYALWIGLSRISVGVHFPVDVLAGFLCGGLCGGLSRSALQWWRALRRTDDDN